MKGKEKTNESEYCQSHVFWLVKMQQIKGLHHVAQWSITGRRVYQSVQQSGAEAVTHDEIACRDFCVITGLFSLSQTRKTTVEVSL